MRYKNPRLILILIQLEPLRGVEYIVECCLRYSGATTSDGT